MGVLTPAETAEGLVSITGTSASYVSYFDRACGAVSSVVFLGRAERLAQAGRGRRHRSCPPVAWRASFRS